MHAGESGASQEGRATILSLFLEVTAPTVDYVSHGWSRGRLSIEGTEDGRRFVPWVAHAVTGSADDPRRWHRLLSQSLDDVGGELIGAEILRLPGFDDGTSVLHLRIAVARGSHLMRGAPQFAGVKPLDIASALDLHTWLGGEFALPSGWGTSPVQRPLSEPSAVGELLCTTLDDPALLPEPSVRLLPAPWSEAQYRMYQCTRDVLEPTPDDISAGIQRVLAIGGGVALVGSYRSVAMADYGGATSVQRLTVDTMLFAVAQNVMLKRLFQLAERLVEPARNPRAAVALSRGVLAYRAVFWWNGAGRPEPESRIIWSYYQQNGLGDLEADLSSFETAAQAAISAQTNVLLGLIAVLGVAVAVAASVIGAASLTGWEALWGLLIAVATAAVLLMLPFGRTLRAAIVGR
jgi:hypothetical protein